jgi:hypothetical protein
MKSDGNTGTYVGADRGIPLPSAPASVRSAHERRRAQPTGLDWTAIETAPVAQSATSPEGPKRQPPKRRAAVRPSAASKRAARPKVPDEAADVPTVDEAPAATPLEVTAPIVPPPAIFGRFEDPAPTLDEHDAAVTAALDVLDDVPAVDPDQAIAYLADVRQRLVDETAVIDQLLEQLCPDPTRRALIRHRAYTTAHPYRDDEAT